MTRAERKARTRLELLRAANRLFVRNGYVATTLDEIASEAGVTVGAVYSNFGTKEDMFLALVDEILDPEARWISDRDFAPDDLAAAIGETPLERAAAWGRAVSRHEVDRRVVALVEELNAVALRSPRSRKRVAEHNQAFFQSLGDRLVAVLDGDPADAEFLALLAQSIYGGLATHIAITGEPLPEEYFARAYRLLAVAAADRPVTS